nr:EOG090X0A5K [Triops cancriformis]
MEFDLFFIRWPQATSTKSKTTEMATITVKWSGREIVIDDLHENSTVLCLKQSIESKTGVKVERQKLLNLKHKGKAAENDVKITALALKPGFKVMMMGSLEESIIAATEVPETLSEVVNDLDMDEEDVPFERKEEYLAKVAKRVETYSVSIRNAPRPGKKLLVLDIDYTLFDHRSAAETANELMRPFLHEFLTSAYQHYDIVIWSATSMKWIEEKMRLLGVASHPDYKIAFYLDYLAMVSVHCPKYGLLDVKPLAVIWGKFPEAYSPNNTIMFDDIRRNFALNPQNGLRIRAFREAHLNRHQDRELLHLSQYLSCIATLEDFSQLNHRHWERYLRKNAVKHLNS